MTCSDTKGLKASKWKFHHWAKQMGQELLMHPQFNQGIRIILRPLRYYKYLPKWFWLRLPVIGTFSVRLPNGEKMYYHSSGEFTGRVLYWQGMWGFEPGCTSLFFVLATSAQVFIDVGAHVGLYTMLAKIANRALDVIAFEPIPHICTQLKHNVMLNDFVNTVIVEQVVITKYSSDSVPFFVSNDASTSSLYHGFVNHHVASKQITVPSYTLDDYVSHQKHLTVDLIKIDVEGAEIDVLEGSKEILLRHRPIILCEILPKHQEAFYKIQSILCAAAYDYAIITPEGLLQLEELSSYQNYHNFLLWPREKRDLLPSSFLNVSS